MVLRNNCLLVAALNVQQLHHLHQQFLYIYIYIYNSSAHVIISPRSKMHKIVHITFPASHPIYGQYIHQFKLFYVLVDTLHLKDETKWYEKHRCLYHVSTTQIRKKKLISSLLILPQFLLPCQGTVLNGHHINSGVSFQRVQ